MPTFDQVFIKDEYRAAYPADTLIIVDAGANIGLFSVYMKSRFPAAKIVAIEPDKENFDMLKRNTAGYADMHFENCGLWSHSTKLKVYDKFNMGKWGLVVEENEDESNVTAISIGDIMQKYALPHIDVLKVDIETSERIVFSKNFEHWLPKVKMIVIELHDVMEEGCSKCFFEAVNKCFSRYEYAMRGDNTIIFNRGFSGNSPVK